MKKVDVNEQIVVTSMGFRKNLATYPRRIEYKGATLSFMDAGLRCLIRQGNRIAEILTLSDGQSDYKLRSDNQGLTWTLISIMS